MATRVTPTATHSDVLIASTNADRASVAKLFDEAGAESGLVGDEGAQGQFERPVPGRVERAERQGQTLIRPGGQDPQRPIPQRHDHGGQADPPMTTRLRWGSRNCGFCSRYCSSISQTVGTAAVIDT